jgi:exosortase
VEPFEFEWSPACQALSIFLQNSLAGTATDRVWGFDIVESLIFTGRGIPRDGLRERRLELECITDDASNRLCITDGPQARAKHAALSRSATGRGQAATPRQSQRLDFCMASVCEVELRDRRSFADRVRQLRLTPASLTGVALIAAVVFISYFGTLGELIYRWGHEADYSHGFLVPFFSAWLLWQRRHLLTGATDPVRGRWLGLVLLVSSASLRMVALYFSFVLVEPVSLIVCIAGVVAIIGGFPALRWAWPAILFLVFMIPLPGFLASRLSGPLQHVATLSSTYLLQTLGIAAISSGNVIWLSQSRVGVVEACSGLRMLMMFGAVTTAAVLLIERSKCEKACLIASSVGIAIVVNICRITAMGVGQELIGPTFAEKNLHDLAGWIMMPLALLLLGLEVILLSKLFPIPAPRPVVMTGRPHPAFHKTHRKTR